MRWALTVKQRVYVRGEPTIGIVSQVGKNEIAVYFPQAYHKGNRVFLWDENIVPVDEIVAQVLKEA